MKIMVMEEIMSCNEELAEANRADFAAGRITVVNVMASPGAGKTSLIMELLGRLSGELPFSVIEGDIASAIDAEKIEAMGIPVIQINTGGGCHLDANMIKEAVTELHPKDDSILFIENVGNLICPSTFDLGETIRLVIASVPEGHDKPYKYISMFEAADVIILSKTDLLPYVRFDKENFVKGIRALNQKAPLFEVSCTTGEGLEKVAEWLKEIARVNKLKVRR
ncbi:MAG TPA: hydrogenase accessory protein HypB [Firmicutes bacterium]|jgi:hydrogenase nickel incorporation protein HypB|nr:hydrogenase accessory protein HypB [Bacillota bacterium]